MSQHHLSLENILEASQVIDPVFLHSPQYRTESLEGELGFELWVKLETLNPIRSFKGRGADYFVQKRLETLKQGLLCASAGNFGQGLAYSCRKHGLKLIVYASVNANPLKLERMRFFGAEVRLHGTDFDAAKLEAKSVAAVSGQIMVEDGLEPLISEGAGSIAVELLEAGNHAGVAFDAVLVPLGNGAVLGGMARWIKAHSPRTRVIGVAASGAPCMEVSWRTGQVTSTPTMQTIADGIGTRIPIPEALEDLQNTIDDIWLVTDSEMLHAMKTAHLELGVVLEPSGAVAFAGAMKFKSQLEGKKVGVIFCGSNLTPLQMEAWLGV
jgi:threonine dehydratase